MSPIIRGQGTPNGSESKVFKSEATPLTCSTLYDRSVQRLEMFIWLDCILNRCVITGLIMNNQGLKSQDQKCYRRNVFDFTLNFLLNKVVFFDCIGSSKQFSLLKLDLTALEN